MTLLLFLSKTLAFIGGCVICYASMFLYETEAREVENVLQEWWIRIDDLRATATRRHVAILRIAAEAAGKMLDRLFGRKLISIQVIAVSGTLSVLSLYFYTAWLQETGLHRAIDLIPVRPGTPEAMRDAIVFATIAIFAALIMSAMPNSMPALLLASVTTIVIASILPRLRWLPVLFFLAIVGVFWIPMVISIPLEGRGTPDIVLAALIIGIITDVVAIMFVRRLLRWQVSQRTARSVFVAATLQLIVAIGLIILPIVVGGAWAMYSYPDIPFEAFAVAWSATTNGFCVVLALTLFLTLAVFLLHVLLWPIVERPLYQLAILGVFKTRTTRIALFAVGTSLLVISTGRVSSLSEHLLKLLGAA